MRNILFLILSVFCTVLFAGEFSLVKKGKPFAQILKTPEVERHISFFNQTLQHCTGTKLPVAEKRSPKYKNAIVFQVEKRGLDTEDAFEISYPNKNTMMIKGSSVSIRWALNGILEELGVCFVFAGPYGTHYPALKDASIRLRNIRRNAVFKLRRHMWAEDPEWEECLNGKRDDANSKFLPHNLGNIFPPEKYALPPWRDRIMPLRNGKRFVPASRFHNWQPCFSDPASVKEAVQNICAILAKTPGTRRFSLGVNDLGGFCECQKCLKMNKGLRKCKFAPHYKSFSEIYFKWANQVVEGVLKKYPGIFFDTLAYRELIDPPSFPVHKNIVPVLAIEIHQNMVPKVRASYKKLLNAWSQRASVLGFWEYGYGSRSYAVPRIYTALQKEIIKFYAQHKGNSFFAEGDSYIGEGPKRYLYYKLSFDPEADLQSLLQKWYVACVGKEAAPYLKAYYDLWEKFWTGKRVRLTPWYRSAGAVYFNFSDPSCTYAVTEKEVIQARSLMEKMRASAQRSGDARQKIRAERLYGFFELNEARIYSQGGGAYPPSDRFNSAEEVVAFLQSVEKMSLYRKKIPALAEAVLAYKDKETFPGFYSNTFRQGMLRQAFSEQIVRILPFLKSEKVLDALRRITQTAGVDPVYSSMAASLLEANKQPNMLEETLQKDSTEAWNYSYKTKVEKVKSLNGTPRFKATSLGGWCCPALLTPMRPNQLYMITARITPDASFSGFNTRVFLTGVKRETFTQLQNPPYTIFPMKKDPVHVYALVKSHQKAYHGKAYFILNGINKGESVYIDSIEMKCLEKPRITKKVLADPAAEDPSKLWRARGKHQWKDRTLELQGPAHFDLAKIVPANKKEDIFRLSAAVKGKGFFRFRILVYSGTVKRPRSLRSDKIRATGQWQVREFESDFSSIRDQGPVRVLIRIETEKNSTVLFRNLKAVVEIPGK